MLISTQGYSQEYKTDSSLSDNMSTAISLDNFDRQIYSRNVNNIDYSDYSNYLPFVIQYFIKGKQIILEDKDIQRFNKMLITDSSGNYYILQYSNENNSIPVINYKKTTKKELKSMMGNVQVYYKKKGNNIADGFHYNNLYTIFDNFVFNNLTKINNVIYVPYNVEKPRTNGNLNLFTCFPYGIVDIEKLTRSYSIDEIEYKYDNFVSTTIYQYMNKLFTSDDQFYKFLDRISYILKYPNRPIECYFIFCCKYEYIIPIFDFITNTFGKNFCKAIDVSNYTKRTLDNKNNIDQTLLYFMYTNKEINLNYLNSKIDRISDCKEFKTNYNNFIWTSQDEVGIKSLKDFSNVEYVNVQHDFSNYDHIINNRFIREHCEQTINQKMFYDFLVNMEIVDYRLKNQISNVNNADMQLHSITDPLHKVIIKIIETKPEFVISKIMKTKKKSVKLQLPMKYLCIQTSNLRKYIKSSIYSNRINIQSIDESKLTALSIEKYSGMVKVDKKHNHKHTCYMGSLKDIEIAIKKIYKLSEFKFNFTYHSTLTASTTSYYDDMTVKTIPLYEKIKLKNIIMENMKVEFDDMWF